MPLSSSGDLSGSAFVRPALNRVPIFIPDSISFHIPPKFEKLAMHTRSNLLQMDTSEADRYLSANHLRDNPWAEIANLLSFGGIGVCTRVALAFNLMLVHRISLGFQKCVQRTPNDSTYSFPN